MTLAAITNLILSVLTIIGQIIVAGLLIFLIINKRGSGDFIVEFIKKNALVFAFFISLSATIGSLLYSEVIGFEPCKLCWYQRVFMYPQVFLLGLAFWRRDYGILFYSMILSAIGAIIAAYHYLLQLGVVPSLSCSAIGYSVACSQRFVLQLGYITIPMMAFTAFLVIFLLMMIKLKNFPRGD